MRSSIGQVVIKLLPVSLSLAVALLLGEGIVRLVEPQDLEVSINWYEWHPIYRFRHRPNMDRRVWWFTYYRLQTNSRGLRGSHEIDYDPGGHWRVLIHGDSMTFGNGVDEDHVFVSRTEKQLQARGLDAQVVNMGVSAYGSSLEYLYFREEGRRYKPDVVVIAVFLGNDFIDDYRDGVFTLSDDELIYHPFEVPWLNRMTNTALYQFIASRSHLFVFLRARLTHVPGQQQEVQAYTDFDRFDEMYTFNEAVLLAFYQEIKNAQAQPIILLLPSPWQLLATYNLPATGDYFPQAGAYREALLQTCAEQHLRCLDMLPVLASATDDPWRLFLHDADGNPDFHYNEAGHALVANTLTDALEDLYRHNGT